MNALEFLRPYGRAATRARTSKNRNFPAKYAQGTDLLPDEPSSQTLVIISRLFGIRVRLRVMLSTSRVLQKAIRWSLETLTMA